MTTAVYCLLVLAFRPVFLKLIGAGTASVLDYASSYLLITVIAGGAGSSMSILFSHIIRSTGSSFAASAGIALGGLLNIALDPLFMFVLLPPGNEVTGAALATAISNTISLLFFIILLLKRKRRSGPVTILSLPDKSMLKDRIPSEIMLTGIPACVMTLVENISDEVMEKLISFYGVEMRAGVVVAKKINMLTLSIVRTIVLVGRPLRV